MVPIDHFDVSAATRPAQLAVIDGDTTLTYAELRAMSVKIAAAVARHGEDGVPVASVLYGGNSYRFVAAMLGILRAGGVMVPLHAPNTAEMSLHYLTQVQPRCLFYDPDRADEVRGIRRAIGSLRECICFDGRADGDRSFADVLNAPGDYEPTWMDASGNAERPVFYWATSGTTGEPKVVVESSRNFDVMLKFSYGLRRHRRNVTLSLAPMTHGGGPHNFAALTVGGTVIMNRTFDAHEVLKTIERYRVDDMWLPPTALYLMMERAQSRRYDLSSLRNVLLGMAGVAPDRMKKAVELFGPCLAHSYGQIETSFVTLLEPPVVAEAVAGVHPERLLSSGTSVRVNRFAIMDQDDRLLPAGEEGEIVVRGTTVKRYLDPAMTAAAQRSGWHRTGDLGYADSDGYLYVVGRVKDVVNMAGFKIPAAEIERTVMEVDGVQECAVVAVPDSVRGEVIKAIVVARPGYDVTATQVIQHCRQVLGNRKTPQSVETWSELPRTSVGKIDKRRIRERILAPKPVGHLA